MKNEVLFNLRCHPLTKLSEIKRSDWPLAIHEIRLYCEHFYEWKKKYELRRHWQVYRKHKCPICGEKIKREKLGRFERSTFYCMKHQKHPHGKRVVHHDVLPPSTPKRGPEKRVEH